MERNSSDSMISTSGQHLSTGTSQGAGGTTPASGASSSHFVNTEVQSLTAAKKKRKRRRNNGNATKDCANCHTKVTPEWRRGPSGQRDLCNSCGLRWAKLNGRVSPR